MKHKLFNYRIVEGVTATVTIVNHTLISHAVANVEAKLGRPAVQRRAHVVLARTEVEADQLIYAFDLRINGHFGDMVVRHQLNGIDTRLNKREQDLVQVCLEISAIHSYVILNSAAYVPIQGLFKL